MMVRQTPDTDRDALVGVASDPEFSAWLERVARIGGCANPIHLVGHTETFDAASGELVHVFTSDALPRKRLLVACGNRRASRCGPCSWLHQGDTYQLIASGLAGGKGTPASVRDRPRVFLTLTAPSFGPVHRVTASGIACRPGRRGTCPHGVSASCDGVHGVYDRAVGTPLCPACYDYTGAVLFNALAGGLWHRFTDNLSRQLAHATGISRTRLREHVRVSYAKVAEYQHRGAIHFHAIIRLDGPDGPGSTPPPWASLSLLIQAARAAHAAAWVASPDSLAVGSRRLRFGTQLDIRPIHTTDDPDGVSEQAVAGYVAKYVTKGDLPGLISDRPIHHRSTIELLPVSEHARTLMSTCWRLGGLTAFAGLNLRTWAHQLGYRGHIATKSRTYSTTYTALRDARAAWQHARHGSPDQNAETVAVSEWGYAGRGYTTGETMFAANIAHDKAVVRENNAEARTLGLGE